MATVYTGLLDKPTDLRLAPAMAELHELGFTTGVNGHGWFAVRELGPYRTRIVAASSGWRVINVFTPTSEVPAYEPRATLADAIDCAISIALSVDSYVTLAALLAAEVNAELGRAA